MLADGGLPLSLNEDGCFDDQFMKEVRVTTGSLEVLAQTEQVPLLMPDHGAVDVPVKCRYTFYFEPASELSIKDVGKRTATTKIFLKGGSRSLREDLFLYYKRIGDDKVRLISPFLPLLLLYPPFVKILRG